ncbi:MAG: hypothetical protein D6704_11955 [Nitrospirae bacterium]|nr:MAG: hypothetical protein D6704_11955 [Nitrospirota bacterium]
MTNDAWFGRTVAPYQHYATVVFRAIETRRAFARAANTGISGFVAPTGRILAATPIFTQQAITGEIPLRTSSTVYTAYGDVFAWICVIMVAVLLVSGRLFRTPEAATVIFKYPSQKRSP